MIGEAHPALGCLLHIINEEINVADSITTAEL